MASVFHYTDADGYKGISSSSEWLFRAAQPPGDHPFGSYFTNLPQDTPALANKLRIPREKLHYVLAFVDHGDLHRLAGDRGRFIFYSRVDYTVASERQHRLQSGLTSIGEKDRP